MLVTPRPTHVLCIDINMCHFGTLQNAVWLALTTPIDNNTLATPCQMSRDVAAF